MKVLARFWIVCAVAMAALVGLPQMGAPALAQSAANSARSAPTATGKPHVYLLRGLANIFSLGMDDLAAKLQARGINATVHSHADWQRLADAATAESRATRRPTPVIIIGHSLGADAAVYMANRVSGNGVPVPLVVTFDPVTPTTASASIGRVVNFYQGGGAGKPVAGPKVDNIDFAGSNAIGHFNIDKLAELHERVIAMITRLDRPARPVRPRPVAPSAAPTASAPAPELPRAAVPTETAAAPVAASDVPVSAIPASATR